MSGAREIDVLASSVAEAFAEGGGCWVACTGCQERVDGCVSCNDYPFSEIFQCRPGSGCSECGGLGVVWDTTDWAGFAEWSLAQDRTRERIEATLTSTLRVYEGEILGLREAADAIVGLEPKPVAQSLETAPIDGTMVWLLVDYSGHGESRGDHPLDDSVIAWTVGFNNDGNVLPGDGNGWQFAGWCWTHDHFTEGRGRPIGWKRIDFDLGADKDPSAQALKAKAS